jgi:hypothetical protein
MLRLLGKPLETIPVQREPLGEERDVAPTPARPRFEIAREVVIDPVGGEMLARYEIEARVEEAELTEHRSGSPARCYRNRVPDESRGIEGAPSR